MDAPTAAQIRTWSRVDFDDRGFEIDTAPNPDVDKLARVVENAVYWLEENTGRELSTVDPDLDRASERMERMVQEAVRMLVEFKTASAQEEHSETASDFTMIQSFSAGSYNEQRRQNRILYRLHPWRELDDLLWDICTDEVKAKFGGGVPAIDADEPDWNVGEEIMNAPGTGNVLTPFGPYDPLWY